MADFPCVGPSPAFAGAGSAKGPIRQAQGGLGDATHDSNNFPFALAL